MQENKGPFDITVQLQDAAGEYVYLTLAMGSVFEADRDYKIISWGILVDGKYIPLRTE